MKETIRLTSGWQVMRHAQIMPIDCSNVLHIEALMIVYVMSERTPSLKVSICTMDATQALFRAFLVSEAVLTRMEEVGEKCKKFGVSNDRSMAL